MTVGFTGFTGKIIDLYPTQGLDAAMEITYSAVPVGDIGSMYLNLPEEARDCIINGALAEILQIPGQDQNIQLADEKRIEYERLKSQLTALGVLGYGGSPQFAPTPFGGNGLRYFPSGFSTFYPGP